MTWHILTTVPQREFRAGVELDALGLRTLVPYELRHRRAIGKGGRPVMTGYRVPLLPGYLFVNGGDDCLPWRDVMELRDVRGCIWSGGIPARLTDAQIDHVRRLAETCRAETRRSLARGDRARIMAGPFSGIEALVSEITSTAVTLEVQMFGSTRAVDMRPDLIERVA